MLSEQRPGSVGRSCVFPADEGYFTFSGAIISRVHGAGLRERSQMDLHGRGDRWKRNPSIIACVTARIFPLLIINLVLSGNIPVIRVAANHWSDGLRHVGVCVPPVLGVGNCKKIYAEYRICHI